ncbi:MAG: hypothetical protein J7485_06165 [Sphingobium sp.]|nr:hypothetical protein [Sphingobium sp.]
MSNASGPDSWIPAATWRDLGILPWFRHLLLGPKSSQSNRRDGRTDPLLSQLAALGVVMLVVLGLYGFSLKKEVSSEFIVWGYTGALSAYLVGVALGMLFGLPTTRGWTSRKTTAVNAKPVAAPAPAPAAPAAGGTEPPVARDEGPPSPVGGSLGDYDIPYDENTSLEQIADWLTKIIVGLTLTQFSVWRDYFQWTAKYLTRAMHQDTSTNFAAINPMPGGLVMTGFALLGFLMAYLWMRRYFIPEMVIARRNAIEFALADANKRLLDAQREASERLLAQKESEINLAKARLEQQKAEADEKIRQLEANASAVQKKPDEGGPSLDVGRIITAAAERLPKTNLLKEALRVISTIPVADRDPDDPWKGRFGGSASRDGYTLEGTVSGIEGNPEQFNVQLKVKADTPEAVEKVAAGKQNAMFFLHPTFGDPVRVAFGADGVAPLSLLAFGAFTVGVLLDEGVMLELNLASLPEALNYPVFLAR